MSQSLHKQEMPPCESVIPHGAEALRICLEREVTTSGIEVIRYQLILQTLHVNTIKHVSNTNILPRSGRN